MYSTVTNGPLSYVKTIKTQLFNATRMGGNWDKKVKNMGTSHPKIFKYTDKLAISNCLTTVL